MKKTLSIFMTIAALSFSSVAFAQKPVKGSVTGEVQLNFQTGTAAIGVVAPSLNFRYFLMDDLALRLKLAITSTKDKTGDVEDKTSNFSFAPGIEKHFKGTDKLSPYIGAEIPISGGKVEHKTAAGSSTDKTSSFGVNLIFGGDYYVWQSVYVGAEVAWGFSSGTSTPEVGEKTTTSGFSLGANSGIRLGMKF